MSRDENLLKTYLHGGAGERMEIFLAHPGLRALLDEIEREEKRESPPVKAAKGKSRSWRLWWSFASGRRASHS